MSYEQRPTYDESELEMKRLENEEEREKAIRVNAKSLGWRVATIVIVATMGIGSMGIFTFGWVRTAEIDANKAVQIEKLRSEK